MSLVNKQLYENKEKQKKAAQASTEISVCLQQSDNLTGNCVPLAAYLLYKASQYNYPFGITMKAIEDGLLEISEETRSLAIKSFSEETWKRLLQLVMKYSSEELALAAVLPSNGNDMKDAMSTPDTILKLIHKILNVKANERVADICCGTGSYLISAAIKENEAIYHGYEIDAESCTVSSIRSELIDANVQVSVCDAFNLAKENLKFDKIFSNYPFGLKLKNLNGGAEYLEKLTEQYPGLSKATSSDWVFNALLCDILAEDGKAIGIMTNGSTWNSIDVTMREHFVEHKMVECVISLPAKMFNSTNISTTLIVLSHNNESVRMIDATNLCQQGRRQNEFSDENIATIVEAINVDSEYSKEITIEQIRNNEYNLSLSRYDKEDISFANGVPFESIIKSITRGAPCTASQLDEMISDKPTNMQYLMLGNIQNGIIDANLPYLSSIEPKYKKYCLKNNSLILSKNGYPYKIAVTTVNEDQQILANGNLYIIELDEEKANPYYIKAFLESKQGDAILKNITVGATIPNIGVDKLKKLMLPLPTVDEQNRIANKYKSALDEISYIKKQLEKAINNLQLIFDDKSEDIEY